MPFGKYKRLLLVVSLPLILIGIVFGELISPYPNSFIFLMCQRNGTYENCRNLGSRDGNLHQSVRKQSPAWFDVEDAPLSATSLSYYVQGDVRALTGYVVGAAPFALNPPAAEITMNQLDGKNVNIILGIRPNEASSIVGDSILLRCNSVRFVADNKFTSGCYGDGWNGRVTYTASGESADMLSRLRDGVNAEVGRFEKDRWMHRVVTYSMFLIGFLLLSGIVWLSRRAIRYVKAG